DLISTSQVRLIAGGPRDRDQVAKNTTRSGNARMHGGVRQERLLGTSAQNAKQKLPSCWVPLDVDRSLHVKPVESIDLKPAKPLERTDRADQHHPDLTAVQRGDVLLDELRESFAIAAAVERVEQRNEAAPIPVQLLGEEGELL